MATIPASENEFPSLLFAEVAAPATPASGLVICYTKSDGLLYCKDDAGVETSYAAATAHIADTSDAHDASAISIADSGAYYTGTDVEAALQELGAATGGTPAGFEVAYASTTTDVSVTGTAEGSETTLLALGSATYANVKHYIEFFSPRVGITNSASGRGVMFLLYEDSTLLGRAGVMLPTFVSGQTPNDSFFCKIPVTPTAAAHTYTMKAIRSNASDSITVFGGDGGATDELPMWIRSVKA